VMRMEEPSSWKDADGAYCLANPAAAQEKKAAAKDSLLFFLSQSRTRNQPHFSEAKWRRKRS
jgi:hypothetical protein